MLSETTMSKDLMFKLRLDAQDRERLDAVAAHLSAPAATAVRIVIKEKYDALEAAKAGVASSHQNDFRWDDHHTTILEIVGEARDPISARDIGGAICSAPYFYDAKFGGTGLALNQLRRNGYLRRLKTGYVITAKGQALTK